MPTEIIPAADLPVVTPGDFDYVVGTQGGDARRFLLAELPASSVALEQMQAIADEARTAADAAALNAGIFPDTAAGLSATADGGYFSVPSPDSAEHLILYRDSAGVAVEVKRYPSSLVVQALADETENYRAAGDPIRPPVTDGWAWNVVDGAGKVAIGVRDDGAFAADTIEANEVEVGGGVLGGESPAGFAWTVEDAAGNVALGIRADGALEVGKFATLPPARTDRFGGRFQHQINYINGTGQSLAYGAAPVQTTAQEYDNLMFPYKSTSPTAFYKAFRTDSEDPTFGTMGRVKELLLKENGITWEINDYQIVATNNAVSAQGIDALSKGGSSGAYEACMSQIAAGVALAASLGKTFAFRAVTWTQGEADASMPSATYKAKMIALAENFNTDGKALTGQTQDVIFITYQNSSNFNKFVAVAQWEAAMEHPLIYLATPMYFFDYVDGQHIVGTSTKWLGGYYGETYKRVVIDEREWQPLQPLSITVSGNNIDIVFNKGGLIFDTTIMPAQASYGFSVVNAAIADQTITNVTILPGNRVRLAMAATPAAGWRVRYGHNVVTGKPNYSSGGGNLRDRQGDFMTYASKPMHNWCVIFDWEI